MCVPIPYNAFNKSQMDPTISTLVSDKSQLGFWKINTHHIYDLKITQNTKRERKSRDESILMISFGLYLRDLMSGTCTVESGRRLNGET